MNIEKVEGNTVATSEKSLLEQFETEIAGLYEKRRWKKLYMGILLRVSTFWQESL